MDLNFCEGDKNIVSRNANTHTLVSSSGNSVRSVILPETNEIEELKKYLVKTIKASLGLGGNALRRTQ